MRKNGSPIKKNPIREKKTTARNMHTIPVMIFPLYICPNPGIKKDKTAAIPGSGIKCTSKNHQPQ
jgi:hypothetical protein